MNGNEIRYTIKTIMNIAFPKYKYNFIKDNLILLDNYQIQFTLMTSGNYQKLINKTLVMKKVANFDNTISIPVFSSKKDFCTINGLQIIINYDILTLPFLLLSRKEEIEINKFDKYGRFIFTESLSYKYDIIDYPIVDEYAMLLRQKLGQLLKIKVHEKNKFKVYLTHDIDNLYRFGTLKQNIKTIFGGDLILRRNIKEFFSSIKELSITKKDNTKDPKTHAIYNFINYGKNMKKNIETHFYFLAYDKKYWDYRYDINDSRLLPIINQIKENKMYYGLHCGFNAYNNNTEYERQYNMLTAISSFEENRDHYLCFDPLETVNILEKNNIKYDYSLGYHDRTGFRCGTCHDYNLYDLKNNKESSVIERPLIVMDGTLRVKMTLSCDEAYKRMIDYYNICKKLGGNFIILWHPDSCIREWEDFYNNVYVKFINFLRGSDAS